MVAGQDEQAPGLNNRVRLVVGNASPQRMLDGIENTFGTLSR
jgi:hypothetical protein